MAGPELRLAVMFGSQATGRAGAGSDVDVGILPVDPAMTLAEELALASALSAASGAEVDLVRLDADDPVLGREVARAAVCLFEREPGVFAAWRADAVSRWIDLEETLSPHRERFLRRLAGGAR
jgi:predicted nucleotidyltransferase